jgi:hypothetical protein
MLIATLRPNGTCPRCCVPVAQYHQMGTPEDMERRKSMIRTDNMEWIEKVKAARSLIYEGKKAVDNKKDVESLLKADSLVPTIVSYHFYHFFSTGPVLNLRLERFF